MSGRPHGENKENIADQHSLLLLAVLNSSRCRYHSNIKRGSGFAFPAVGFDVVQFNHPASTPPRTHPCVHDPSWPSRHSAGRKPAVRRARRRRSVTVRGAYTGVADGPNPDREGAQVAVDIRIDKPDAPPTW